MSVPKSWAVIACICSVVWACSGPEEPAEEEDFEAWERPVEGEWYQGDLHVHAAGASNDAAEESTPERIREVAMARGIDFLVLTDHSNSTGSDSTTTDEDPDLFNQGPEFTHWDEAIELSDDDFLVVQGNEISPVSDDTTEPRGHIGCIPSTLEGFDPDVAFVDRPRGEVTGGESLQQGLDAGCFTILNHPFGPVPWISYDWTSYDYDAMEVWNGGAKFNLFDMQAVQGWACDLSQGRRVVPVGGSDNHKVEVEPPGTIADSPLGTPVTWVYGEALNWESMVDALYAGKVSVTDTGQPLEVDVFDADGRWLAMSGGAFDAAVERQIRLRGNRVGGDGDRILELIRIPQNACDDTRAEGEINAPEPNWEVVEEWTLTEAAEFDEKVAVDAEEGDIFFVLMTPETVDSGVRDVAISGAVFAE